MIKSMPYFLLLFISIFIIPGCTNTQPKVLEFNNVNDMKYLPNLTGQWVLNKELSQSPQDQLKQDIRKPKNSQGNQNKGNRGSGNGRGNKSRRSDNYSRNKKNNAGQSRLPQSLRALLKSSETLMIKHIEPLLQITTSNTQEDIYTDFRSTHVSSHKGPNQKITIAGWEDNILIVESTLNSGRVIQQFNLKAAPKQLWINTEILTPHLPKPVKFNRVYELIKTATE